MCHILGVQMMLTWHVFKHTSLYSKYTVKLCVTFTTKKKNTTELAVLICSFFPSLKSSYSEFAVTGVHYFSILCSKYKTLPS